jgi:ABC-type sugar transport system substrate-binding protein
VTTTTATAGPRNALGLFLPDATNDYQDLVRADVVRAAARAGLDVVAHSAGNSVMSQISQLFAWLHGPSVERTRGLVVMPVLQTALDRVIRDGARVGVPWAFIQRRPDKLDALRAEFPQVPLFIVMPDQREIGAIQARQYRALLPRGGTLLYVQGQAASSPAQARLAGLQEGLEGSGLQIATVLDGNWRSEDAERAVTDWLVLMLRAGGVRIDLVGCQSDMMAVGVKKALAAVAERLQRPEVARIPVTGCDGHPQVGRKLVDEGQLAATIVVPSTGAPAVEQLLKAIASRQMPPAELILHCTSYPEEPALAARPR